MKSGKSSGSSGGLSSSGIRSGDSQDSDGTGGLSTSGKIVFISVAGVVGIAIIARIIWGCFHKSDAVEDEDEDNEEKEKDLSEESDEDEEEDEEVEEVDVKKP